MLLSSSPPVTAQKPALLRAGLCSPAHEAELCCCSSSQCSPISRFLPSLLQEDSLCCSKPGGEPSSNPSQHPPNLGAAHGVCKRLKPTFISQGNSPVSSSESSFHHQRDKARPGFGSRKGSFCSFIGMPNEQGVGEDRLQRKREGLISAFGSYSRPSAGRS